MSELAVSARGLERRFGRVDAVAGVDLAIERGEVYGFLGPNGAGKSTVVRMLTTLLLPSGGQATVAGHDVVREAQAVRLRIGAALQEASLDDRQTGLELLRVQARLYGLRGAEVGRRIDAVCELIELDDAINRRIGTYSGGMRRRLDLATALIHQPEVLFLDEPTTGLDPASRARVWEEVERLNRETGTTIFLTTQYLEEADRLADRVGIIDHGRLVGEGAPADLKRSVGQDLVVVAVDDPGAARVALAALPEVDAVAVHGQEVSASVGDGPAAVTPIAVALERAGVGVRELSMRQPTLDDVFLELTGARLQVDGEGDGDEEAPSGAAAAARSDSSADGAGSKRRRALVWVSLIAFVAVMGMGLGLYAWLTDPGSATDTADEPAMPAAAESPEPAAPEPPAASSPAETLPPPPPAAAEPSSAELVIAGTPPLGSWVQIREGDALAPVVFEGIFAPDTSESFPVTEELWMRVGNTDGLEVSLDAEPQQVGGGTADFIVTPEGVTPA